MGNPGDHAARDILSKLSIFLPLRAILKKTYHYETPCILDVLWGQPIKLIQVVSTSEFHEY